MKTNKWLIGCTIGCLALLALGALGLWIGYRYYFKPVMSQFMGNPEELGSPRVVKGAGLLTRSVFFSDPRLASVTDIATRRLDSTPGAVLGVAGVNGAAFLDASGNVKSSVKFAHTFRRINLVDVEGDGICEFMDRGSWGANAALLNHAGKARWTYGGNQPGVDDMAAGDVDGDGKLEFAVGFNGSGGVHLLGSNGKARWQQRDTNVWHVEIADLNGDGRAEIVHSNARGELTRRDDAGNVISQVRPSAPSGNAIVYFSQFSLCQWPAKTNLPLLLTPSLNHLFLFDASGKAQAALDAPNASQLGAIVGTPVKLQSNAPTYLAAAVTLLPARKSVLYLYDGSKALVYEEVLPEECSALAALPLGKTGAEALLVGGEGKVWEYVLTPGGGGKVGEKGQ